MMSAWKKWLSGRAHGATVEPSAPDLQQMQLQLHHALRGCAGPMSQRMRWRIDETYAVEDLWLLRGEIFQLVAGEFCQEEAAQRINALLPVFSGWVPERMLARI